MRWSPGEELWLAEVDRSTTCVWLECTKPRTTDELIDQMPCSKRRTKRLQSWGVELTIRHCQPVNLISKTLVAFIVELKWALEKGLGPLASIAVLFAQQGEFLDGAARCEAMHQQ